jgi:hypothetical protein
MSIYAMHDVFPAMGRARADATGRHWFLVQDVRTGRQRMTDDLGACTKETVLQVFKPAAMAAVN